MTALPDGGCESDGTRVRDITVIQLVLGDLLITVGGRATTLGGLGLGEVLAVFLGGAVYGLLKDGLGFVDVELGLEGANVIGEATAVGAAASIGEAEVFINDFLASIAPIASAATILLHLLGIDALVAVLRKVARQVLLGRGSSVGQAGVVTVVVLVRSSHLDGIGVVEELV